MGAVVMIIGVRGWAGDATYHQNIYQIIRPPFSLQSNVGKCYTIGAYSLLNHIANIRLLRDRGGGISDRILLAPAVKGGEAAGRWMSAMIR